MRTSFSAALAYSFAMGAVILLCRALPFILFKNRENGGNNKNGALEQGAEKNAKTGGKTGRKPGDSDGKGRSAVKVLLDIAEKTSPPAAMTVLAFNSAASSIKSDPGAALPVLAASAVTALLHLWKRNSLLSIIGGTVVYISLNRIIMQ
jgi:branched-subunit amino acid transport protein AzlD